MPHAERVPVKFHGVTIGAARVDDDGTIEITMEGPNEPGKLLLEYIQKGLVEGLSLAPITTEVIAARYSENERRSFTDFVPIDPPKNQGHNY